MRSCRVGSISMCFIEEGTVYLMNRQCTREECKKSQDRPTTLEIAFLAVVITSSLLMLLDVSSGQVSRQLLVWGVVFATMIPGILQAARTQVLHVTCGQLVLLMFVLAVWRLLSVYWTVDQPNVFLQSVKTFVLCVFAVSVDNTVSSMSRMSLERFAQITVPMLLCATGLHIFLSLARESAWHLVGQEAIKGFITAWQVINTGAAVVMMTGCLNWILVLHGDKRTRRLGWLMWALAWTLLIVMRCRAAQIGFLFSNIVVFTMTSQNRRRLVLIGVVSAIAVVGVTIVFQYYGATLPTRVLTLHGRARLFRAALMTIDAPHGLIGIGSGAWNTFAARQGLVSLGLPTSRETGELIRGGVHSALLQTWMEDGLIGLVCYIGVFIVPFRCVRRRQRNLNSNLPIPLYGFLMATFIRNLAESNGILFGSIDNASVFMSWLMFLFVFQYAMQNVGLRE